MKEIGNNVLGVRGDVSKLDDLDRLYETVRPKGRIDIVFANAGVGDFAPLEKVTEEHFDKIFNINVRGTLFISLMVPEFLKIQDSSPLYVSCYQGLSDGNAGASERVRFGRET